MTEETAEQKPLHKRWEIIVPTAIAAVIVIGYSIIWFAVAGTVRSQLAERRNSGLGDVQFNYSAANVSGFPFGLRIKLDGPRAAGNNWNWQAETVEMRMSIFSPSKFTLLAAGTHNFNTDGRRIRINLDTAVSQASVSTNGWNANINTSNISAAVDGRKTADIEKLNVLIAQDFDTPSEMTLTLTADNTTLTVIPPVLKPLKTTVRTVRANGTLTDVQNLSRKGRTGQYPELNIESSEVLWGPLNASVQGNLGLDSSSRAHGQLQLGLTDIATLQENLRDTSSAIPTKTTLILEIIKRAGSATVPVNIHAGEVSLAGFPITTIPPLKSKRR